MAVDGDRGARVDQARGLMLAFLLAGLAGMVDAIGFLRLGHLFVSYMSGNSTQFAVALGRGRVTEAGSIVWLIALFVAGAAGGQMIAHFSGRWHLTCVLAWWRCCSRLLRCSERRPSRWWWRWEL
jgi:uncharacterized membrane protein YoaK (UPF0700 family)